MEMLRAFESRCHPGSRLARIARLGSCLAVGFTASVASAGIHTWDVREVYSNADGSIQFIELFDSGNAANGGTETGVGNGSLTSGLQTHSWTNGAVAAPTNGKSYLIASQSFADLPGAPTPDVIIPANKVPFFNRNGDTIGFAGVDSWNFGAVPTDGINSLSRVAGVATNNPKNYAGVQGSVDGTPPEVPTASVWMGAGLVASLAALGVAVLRRRSAAIG